MEAGRWAGLPVASDRPPCCVGGLRSGAPGPFGGGLGVSPGVYLGGLLGGRLGLDSFGQLWEGSTVPAGF